MELKIKPVVKTHFRNNEHFQFHTDFYNLVKVENPVTLKISEQFSVYEPCYRNEDEALKKVSKSATTEQIVTYDREVRDPSIRGLVATNKALLNHYDPEIVVAARRLKIVFDTFGDVAKMPLNEETSGIYNLIQELTTKYSVDLQKVGLTQWVATLNEQNKEFEALVTSRNDENALRTELKMKETRVETDKVYDVIVTRVNALIVIEGSATYESFVKKLNSYIDKYNNAVSQRRGRNKSKAGS